MSPTRASAMSCTKAILIALQHEINENGSVTIGTLKYRAYRHQVETRMGV